MEQRPDSPIDKKPDASAPAPSEEQVVHHVSNRKKRKKGVGGEGMELQLTSMIDVIFQLLIYFVITANFMVDEGTIVATLPGNGAPTDLTPPPTPPPYLIVLGSLEDGKEYTLVAGRTSLDTISELYGHLQERVASSEMSREDPVQLQPDREIRWQHVVNAYNACVKAEMEEITLSP